MPMRPRLLWLALALTAVVVLPPQAAGCTGKTACIKATNGMCPSAAEATAFFNDTSCAIRTVHSADGEATFDGELCCYPVTEASGLDAIPDDCGAGGDIGVGGAGGASGGGGGGGDPAPCGACACNLLMSEGGCKDICDMNFNGTTTPNFCNGASALAMCAACIQTSCGEDPSPCD